MRSSIELIYGYKEYILCLYIAIYKKTIMLYGRLVVYIEYCNIDVEMVRFNLT